jgi:hypothetical protein
MRTVNVLVDGFNLYHSLRKNPMYKWADLRKLSQFLNDEIIYHIKNEFAIKREKKNGDQFIFL